MNTVIERITGDRWFRFLIGVNAYMFFIILLLKTLERNSLPAQYLFITFAALLLIRIVFLIIKRQTGEGRTNDPKMQVLQNASVSIGYLAALAIILEKDATFTWLLYGLIGLTVLISVCVLITLAVKRK